LALVAAFAFSLTLGLCLTHFAPIFTDAEGRIREDVQNSGWAVLPILGLIVLWYVAREPAETSPPQRLPASFLRTTLLSFQATVLILVAAAASSTAYLAWSQPQLAAAIDSAVSDAPLNLPHFAKDILAGLFVVTLVFGVLPALLRRIYLAAGWSASLAFTPSLTAFAVLFVAVLDNVARPLSPARIAGLASLVSVTLALLPLNVIRFPHLRWSGGAYLGALTVAWWFFSAGLGFWIANPLTSGDGILTLSADQKDTTVVAVSLIAGFVSTLFGLERLARALARPRRTRQARRR
jgi:hypothetical protein